jgi:hypothetical protein
MESPVPRGVARRVWEGGCRLRAFRKEGLRAVPLPHSCHSPGMLKAESGGVFLAGFHACSMNAAKC